MKRIASKGGLFFLVLVLMLYGAPLHAADRTIVLLQSLTGPGAFLGVSSSEGMKLAAQELNAQKFLGDDKIVTIVVDDGSDRAQATSAVSRYGNDPAVLMILGPNIAPTSIPAASVANELKIPLFSMPNVPDLLSAGPWSFMGMQQPKVTMALLGQYVVDTLRVKNCAMVSISDNEAYVNITRSFRDYVVPRGINFIDETGVRSTDSDFSAVSTRIVAAKPDCVFLFTTAPIAANLAIQLKQAGLDPSTKLIGHNALASPQLTKIGGSAVEGVFFFAEWAPGGSSPEGKQFADAYKKAKGIDPDNWAAMGYTFMKIAAQAIKNAGPNPTREAVRSALTMTKDVPVIVGKGLYSFDDQRSPTMGLNFLTVKDGAFVRVPQ